MKHRCYQSGYHGIIVINVHKIYEEIFVISFDVYIELMENIMENYTTFSQLSGLNFSKLNRGNVEMLLMQAVKSVQPPRRLL